jgi:two-component system, OmpR family, sensor kinase
MPERPSRPPFRQAWRHPRLWPVRWRLAAVSAVLTFLILVMFALVVGRLASSRIQGDFDNELTEGAQGLAVQIPHTDLTRPPTLINPDQIPTPSAAIRIFYPPPNGTEETDDAARSLGPRPTASGISHFNGYEIATVQVPGLPSILVQYGRSDDSVNTTIDRLWLFLLAGVIGGTALATLAGVAVAGRAMRPIAGLTATARGIATTRDPSRRVPVPNTDDEIAELAITLDQMLRELDAARTETDVMIQAQRDFVADASHELRTPLTSILANLELLQARLDEIGSDGEEGEIIDGALRSSRRMGRLVSDLLLLARADAGRASNRIPCDLTEIAEGALAEVRPVASGRRLELASASGAPVLGSPDELHRLVLNLLENAIRHTPAGTEVRVDVGRRGGNVVLEVSDDGPGIPEGMQEQIFARFVRGSGPADLATDGGTGLGLAIVAAVAGSHGGTVDAGASKSGGARFTVTLPAAASPEPAEPPRPLTHA